MGRGVGLRGGGLRGGGGFGEGAAPRAGNFEKEEKPTNFNIKMSLIHGKRPKRSTSTKLLEYMYTCFPVSFQKLL